MPDVVVNTRLSHGIERVGTVRRVNTSESFNNGPRASGLLDRRTEPGTTRRAGPRIVRVGGLVALHPAVRDAK
jgi:hypothetical protein